MPAKVIKLLRGHSHSHVELMQDETDTWVRKSGDIDRNLERIAALDGILPMPRILKAESDMYEMEYIPHTDMVTWLTYNQPTDLIIWLHHVVAQLRHNEQAKDYLQIYHEKLGSPLLIQWWPHLPFDANVLIAQLPRFLPTSQYHGDLTMDNILFNKDRGFCTIDPLTSPYDSWVFDLAKLRQDLRCGWFIRHTNLALDAKLGTICNGLSRYQWWDNDYLVILMLLRVLPYASADRDKRWLIGEIKKLWK